MAQKPSIPKGTRDFGPVEMAKRNYIFDTIKEVYALYGFQQIETPAMETLQTLMGKYGEEGDKLLFKILNSGDYMNKVSDEDLHSLNSLKLAAKLCEKGYATTLQFLSHAMWYSIARSCSCLSSAIRFSLYGEQTVHRRVVIVSSISAMPTLLVPTLCSTRLN